MIIIKEINEKRQKNKALYDKAADIRKKADDEKRAMGAEELNQFNAIMDEFDTRAAEIRGDERMLVAAEDMAKIQKAEESAGGGARAGSAEKEARAFKKFIVGGMGGLDDEERALMSARAAEQRAFSAGTANTGGYTVPEGFLARLEVALKALGGMLGAVDLMHTDSGAVLPMPSLNDTAASGELISENAQATADSSTPFGVVNMNAYLYSSKVLPVSINFLLDTAFDEGFIADMLGERLRRILNTHFTTGDNSSKPQGIVPAAALGKTGTAGQTTSIIYQDIVDLFYSVDSAYRANGSFMMNDASLKMLRGLKDSQNRPLWEPSLQVGQPDLLLGRPVVFNSAMADPAASQKSILFGDLKKYKVRFVRDVALLRLTERYADYLQVGFLAFLRADGRLMDAGTNPVKYYAHPAS